jgi:hypothetical protein
MRKGRTAIERPLPVGAAIQDVGKSPDFALLFRVPVEIGGASEHSRKKERRVDGRELAVPNPAATLHVEEVVVEAFVTGGIALRSVWTAVKESEAAQHEFGSELARDHTAFDEHRDGRESEPDGGDAAWRRGVCLIAD